MKKGSIKNIIVISVLIAFLFSGNFDYSGYCESEECCKTECCVERSGSDYSGMHLSVNNPDCCEYSKAFENEVHAVSSLSSNVKSNLSSPSVLQPHFLCKNKSSYIAKKSSARTIPESHSISILRI